MRGPSTCSADAAHDKHPLKLKHKFQNNLYLSVKHNYYGDDFRRIYAHTARAKQAGISTVATNDVHYHVPERQRQYTLIGTAKLNDVDPQAWLADVLGQIADLPQGDLHQFLPWNWKAAQRQALAA